MGVQEAGAIVVGVIACGFDLHSRRIPNRLTFGAALGALLYATATAGVAGAGSSAMGWIIALLLFLPFFLLGGMGAGDVKLMAAVGAWLGTAEVVHAVLYAALAGALLALVLVVLKGRARQTFFNLQMLLMHWRIAGIAPHPELTLATSGGPRLAYAVPVLAGTVAAVWLR
jgi:prepilin peptidase CpaA